MAESVAPVASSVPTQAAPISKAYRRYVLIILTAVYTFNFIDRQIMGILGPAIKADLKLTDGELGVLIGFAFAVLYTTLGIPAARISDRANRVSVVAIALALWSGFTALSGFATSYAQLALARVGVGIGEAGGSPPSHALLSDLYPKEERAGALAVYAMGIPIGVTLAYLGGGWVATNFSWRTTFIAVGLPGLLLAVIVKLTVREPVRGASDAAGAQKSDFMTDDADAPKNAVLRELHQLWRATVHLLSIPTYRWVVFGLTAGSFASYALGGWIVMFFRRTHPELSPASIYVSLGLITGTAYVIGVFVGGALVDRRARTSRKAYGYIPAAALALSIPCFLGALWAEDPWVSFALFWPVHMLVGFYLGPCFALAQTLAPVSIRALSTAIFFFILNLIALGFGPTYVGAMSQSLTPSMGETVALQVSLSTVVVAIVCSILFFLMLTRSIERDWAKATGSA